MAAHDLTHCVARLSAAMILTIWNGRVLTVTLSLLWPFVKFIYRRRLSVFCCICLHYDDVIMGAIASQITSLRIVYSTVYSGADQSKHQSSASLAFVWGIHRGPVNSPHKWPVTRNIFPFDDVIMLCVVCRNDGSFYAMGQLIQIPSLNNISYFQYQRNTIFELDIAFIFGGWYLPNVHQSSLLVLSQNQNGPQRRNEQRRFSRQVIICPVKYGMNLLIHSPRAAPLKFGNGYVTSSNTL